MNSIRQIQALNKRELEAGVSTSASWHNDYRDTAFIYIGGLPFDLSEGDIVTIFSQYGEPVYINLVRDKESGKSKGFAFLKYEDQRSTDLAVDNLGGATLFGRVLRVDHTRYKRKNDEEIKDNTEGIPVNDHGNDLNGKVGEATEQDARPLLQEEMELAELIKEHDDDDPMKEYLVQQKREEVDAALKALKRQKPGREDGKKRHHHHHRSRREDMDVEVSSRRHARKRSNSPHAVTTSHHERPRSHDSRGEEQRRHGNRRSKGEFDQG